MDKRIVKRIVEAVNRKLTESQMAENELLSFLSSLQEDTEVFIPTPTEKNGRIHFYDDTMRTPTSPKQAVNFIKNYNKSKVHGPIEIFITTIKTSSKTINPVVGPISPKVVRETSPEDIEMVKLQFKFPDEAEERDSQAKNQARGINRAQKNKTKQKYLDLNSSKKIQRHLDNE